ncbi:MAG: ECF-type sigma factor, partial [Planctomycetota bacterium]
MFDPDRLLENSVDRPSTSGVLELARKAQDGDPTALGQLFQHFEEPLRRMVRIRLGAQLRAGGGIESLDVVQ